MVRINGRLLANHAAMPVAGKYRLTELLSGH
jgi:hypothetical protein